jgi:hypothetical protein
MRILIASFVLSVGLAVELAPAQAQTTAKPQVTAMVEALRQAAPKTGRSNDGLYSDWQVKPGTLTVWSKSCLKQQVTPAQFDRNPALAREVVTCVVEDEFGREPNKCGIRQRGC